MSWDGVERRSCATGSNEFCSAHINYASDIAVIKNSVKNIEESIKLGSGFRNAVVTSIISMGLVLFIQIVSFGYVYGQLYNQVKVNTERLGILEKIQRDKISTSNIVIKT